MSFFWTDDEKNHVAVLLRAGLSAGKIAVRLECSRNAVIGVVSRDPVLKKIGLSGRATRPPPAPKTTVRISPSVIRRAAKPALPVKPRPVAPPDPVAPTPLNLSLADLRTDQCKWPVNDPPKGEPYLFCGHARFGEKPYCAYHAHRGVRHD